MTTASYAIAGGDYAGAGSASSGVKEMLKRIGAEPRVVRRTMIAAYEAEMNVVVHAHGGTMRVVLDNGRLDVEVVDEGPGIPDIEEAMREGFSTAPPEARELGFGAGMGLPNIRNSSDRFAIDSTVGEGTRVRFTIRFGTQAAVGSARHSVRVAGELCRECLRCLRACATRALRVRGGEPGLLEHLCIDCTACIEACETGALAIDARTDPPRPPEGAVVVVPPAFLAQFGPGVSPERVVEALRELGYRDAVSTARWEAALRRAVLDYARAEARRSPVISPVCPAVVNLIELRFPSLIPDVAPFLSPIEAARAELAGENALFVAACPSQHTALRSGPASSKVEAIATAGLLNAVLRRLDGWTNGRVDECRQGSGVSSPCFQPSIRPVIHPSKGLGDKTADTSPDAPEAEPSGPVLEVEGISHVVRVLEEAENGLLPDVEAIEPYACDHGCFGSPLFREDAFVARRRCGSVGVGGALARAVRRGRPFASRPGLRLDADMAKAIEKLSRIDELTRRLPGKDCATCGAPTCGALAEDIVLGRASEAACIHLAGTEEGNR